MPNWVYNRVTGSKKLISQLLDSDGNVTFKNVVSPPQELELIDKMKLSPDSREVIAVLSFFYDNDTNALEDYYNAFCFRMYSTYDSYLDYVHKTFTPDVLTLYRSLGIKSSTYSWYDWNCKYWGCKWDADSSDFSTYDSNAIEIEFMTPWSVPEPVISALVEKFPYEDFNWHCDEESCAFSVNFVATGRGTYFEEESAPEYFTPYVSTQPELEDYTSGCTNLTEVKQEVSNTLPDKSYTVLVDNDHEYTIEVCDPYDDDYESYTCSWNKDGTMCYDD